MAEITIANTFGALQIGSSISIFLFGIVTLQVHVYFSRFQDDRLLFKGLVTSIWFLELGHTISVFYEVYRTTITLYGRPEAAVRFPSIGVVIILGGLITAIVQIFFAYRLWRLLPKPYNMAGVVTALTAFVRCIISVYGGINTIMAPVYLEYVVSPSSQRLVLALLSIGAIIDAIIAVSMVYFLVKRRERALSKVTRLIDRLIGFSLRTGLLTSLSAIAVLIVPNTLIYFAIYTSLAKLYSNTLLSSLNSRSSMRNAISSSTVSVDGPRRKVSVSRSPYINNAISIEMKTVTEFKGDSSV